MPYESVAAVTERQVHEQAVCQQGSGLRKICSMKAGAKPQEHWQSRQHAIKGCQCRLSSR